MDKLNGPLQESVLTLIAVDVEDGKIACGLLDANVFDDGVYKDIAERILKFRKDNNAPPGKAHLDDLVADILANPGNKKHKQYVRIIEGILSQADSLNAPYVRSKVTEFCRRQTLKGALLRAGEVYQSGGDDVVDKVEDILQKALKTPVDAMDKGIFLGDSENAFGFLETTRADYVMGIPDLDKRNLGPTRGEMLLFLAPKSGGKSWFCVDQGRRCLIQGAKVLHITLEMSEDRCLQRYWQNFFAVGKRREKINVTEFEFDELERITGFSMRKRNVKRSFEDPEIREWLRKKMKRWGTRLNRLLVKNFPMKSLTVQKLDAYLDWLELVHKFIPTVLIVDYIDEMYTDAKNHRTSLGWTVSALRGLLQRRNIAGICPTQTNRSGWGAAKVQTNMVSEDASKVMTADMILTYSQTEQEKELGLARILVANNRNDEQGYTIVISQNYTTGQFVLSSTRMHDSYWNLIKPSEDTEEDEDG